MEDGGYKFETNVIGAETNKREGTVKNAMLDSED